MDKRLTKEILRGAGIETPLSFEIPAAGRAPAIDWNLEVQRHEEHIPLPWIAKPSRLGSSVGVEVFGTAAEFLAWLRALEGRRGQTVSDPVALEEFLVEEMVSGRELTCGVIDTSRGPEALPPVEIRPRGGRLFDYEAKYTPGATEEICPAPLSSAETVHLQDCVLRVHRLFGCDPLSRTDVFLLDDGRFTVLEVNTLPGMTPTSLIPLSAAERGISLEDLFDALVEHALRRSGKLPSALEITASAGNSQ
jgi:D-alanine-D-alanine ligase